MNPAETREILDRLRRTECRIVTLASHLGVDLISLSRNQMPEYKYTLTRGFHVEIGSLDTPVSKLRKCIAEAYAKETNAPPIGMVPVYFHDELVATVPTEP